MLKSKIEKMMEEKRLKFGIMGSESCTIELTLTELEKEEFFNIEFSDDWNWEFEGNTLAISYTE